MEYTKLGKTGLDVSHICLECMGFGNATTGFHKWVLGEDASREVIKHAIELGITFFDTANVYSRPPENAASAATSARTNAGVIKADSSSSVANSISARTSPANRS